MSQKPLDPEAAEIVTKEALVEMVATDILVWRIPVERPSPPKPLDLYTRAAVDSGISPTKTLEEGLRDGEINLWPPLEPSDPKVVTTMTMEIEKELVIAERPFPNSSDANVKENEEKVSGFQKVGQKFYIMGQAHICREESWGSDERKSVLKIMG